MKKMALSLALLIGGIPFVNATTLEQNLEVLKNNKNITEICASCILGTLPTVKTNESKCLSKKIKPTQNIKEMVAVFESCTKTELDYVADTCSKACEPDTPEKTARR